VGYYSLETLKCVVQEGQGEDKIFAINALGLMASTKVDPLLIPGLQSENRSERFASAIALGRHRKEGVFPCC
jgi:hypothetical protein